MKSYYPTINLLRGIAATMVCLFHFIGYSDFRGDLISNDTLLSDFGNLGTNGVFVFFVISGFVIPFSLSKNNFEIKSFPQFLIRRFIRIEIPYIISIFLILVVTFLFALKNNIDFSFNIKQLIYHVFYLIPFSDFEWYNIIYWTLAIEFQFYITIGVLYLLLKSKKESLVFITLLVFGLTGFVIDDNRFIFHYTTIFLQGIILFVIQENRIQKHIGWTLIVSSACATAFIHTMEIAIFSLITVVAIAFIEIDKKWSNRFGDISYSLYLTHGLVGGNLLYFLTRYTENNSQKIALILIALIFSIVFAFGFWKIIENPSKKQSKKFRFKAN